MQLKNQTLPKNLLGIAAWIVSVLFHPLNMVLAGCMLITALVTGVSVAQIYVFAKVLVLMLFVLPLVFVPLYWLYIKISQREFSAKQQRLTLLLSTSIIYIYTAVNLVAHSAFSLVNTFILASGILLVLSFGITIFWKISLHAIGVGGFLALIIQLSLQANAVAYMLIPVAILLAGGVISARLYLNAHTPGQVIAGFFLGIAVVFLLLNI